MTLNQKPPRDWQQIAEKVGVWLVGISFITLFVVSFIIAVANE